MAPCVTATLNLLAGLSEAFPHPVNHLTQQDHSPDSDQLEAIFPKLFLGKGSQLSLVS